MLKVICINDKEWYNEVPCPKFGEIVTVSDSDNCPDGSASYEFVEYGKYNWYSQKYFAPIDPDLDETTLVNEEFEEKYCVPVASCFIPLADEPAEVIEESIEEPELQTV